MISHPELGLDPPIGSDRESGCDIDDQKKEMTECLERDIM